MSSVALRKKIRDVEFWVVRDGQGGYIINDNPSLDPSITNQIYRSVGQAYQAAYNYIVKGIA